MIAIRHMNASELDRIGEIDRSEHVTREYSYRDGALEERVVDIAVPNWSPTGDHEHTVQGRINACRTLIDDGGTLVGAFDAEALAGVAVYRPRLTQDDANLAILYVSRSHRRMGVAALLTDEVARLARADGARRLYVSATPSDSAVGFYRSYGFEPTNEPNAALFALEPDDLHMILVL